MAARGLRLWGCYHFRNIHTHCKYSGFLLFFILHKRMYRVVDDKVKYYNI